jgi:MFS family permease
LHFRACPIRAWHGEDGVVRLFGVCCGLSIFSAVILSGLLVGNPVERIVLRAVLGLAGGFLLGAAAGWIGLALVGDNLPKPPPRSAEPPATDTMPESPRVVS